MVSEKKLNDAIGKHEESLVRYLESESGYVMNEPKITISAAVAAIGMYRSSKRLEHLSVVLIVLTLVLAVLTATLVWRTLR